MKLQPLPALLTAVMILVGCSWAGSAAAAVTLAGVFTDHLVLQQGQPIPVWGWAAPGEAITVTLGAQTATTTATPAGTWRVVLAKLAVNAQPQELRVAGSTTVTVKDVLVGEVWLCSGQSNMVFELANANRAEEEIAAATHPLIRIFRTPFQARIRPQERWDGGAWKVCQPEHAAQFPAVAYFFARQLQEQLKVPVGVVISAVGATPAEWWVNHEGIASDATLKELETQYERAAPNFPPALDTRGWEAPEFAATDWKMMTLPGAWEKSGQDLDKLDGAVWFRREVQVPAGWAGRPLTVRLGPIDDGDDTYFNGVHVGGLNVATPNVWKLAREYAVPAAAVKAGRAVIAVRVTDQLGDGGMVGTPDQMSLAPTDAPADAVSLAGPWQYAIEERWPPQQMPTTLFAGMVAAWTQVPLAGIVWYQGESNAGNAARYQHLLRALISGWRAAWRQPELPFVVVQLPNYGKEVTEPGESNWAGLREAQAVVATTTPHVGLAVTIDLGEPGNIHPKNKQDVGQRVAWVALAQVYQVAGINAPPICDRVTTEGASVRLHFTNVGKGLMAAGGELKGFAMAGKDHHFVGSTARIDGASVIVQSEQVAAPVAVRYAWADSPTCTLKNAEGLPAAPFRTDGETVIPTYPATPEH